MGVSTTVHVGHYVVAKMKEIESFELDLQCSNNSRHRPARDAKFCAQCGGTVAEVRVPYTAYQSITGVMFESTDFSDTLNAADKKYLLDNFEGIESEWIGYEPDDYEIVMLSHFNHTIDCDDAGVYNLGTSAPSEAQRTELLKSLKKIMEYKSVELRYGVLIQQS